jgi:hypothetical protein
MDVPAQNLLYPMIALFCWTFLVMLHSLPDPRLNRNRASVLLASLLLTGAGSAMAVEPHTEHTFRLSEGESSPAASLADAAWLVGIWTGTAFGKQFEEVWNPPSAGSMIGLFKLFGEDSVEFYELLLLTVEEGTLSLKVKHFNADFSAWEEKGDFVDFRLVKREENALHFAGISFYRRDDDHIEAHIVMRKGEAVSEHELKYVRRGAGKD